MTLKRLVNNMTASNDNVRIDTTTAVFMVIVAVFFDLISIIPGLNIVSLIFGNGILGFWLFTKGVGLMSGKKIATWGIETLVEAIPALSAFPSITIGVIVIVAITRTEDATGINPLDVKDSLSSRIGDKAKKPSSSNDSTPTKSRITSKKLRSTGSNSR